MKVGEAVGIAVGATAIAAGFFGIGRTMAEESCRARVLEARLRCEQGYEEEEGLEPLEEGTAMGFLRQSAAGVL